MLEWPRPLFDLFYVAFRKRTAVEELKARKSEMIAAFYANSAFYKSDDGPKIRQEMVDGVSDRTEDLINQIYGAPSAQEIEDRLLNEDPFYKPIKAALESNSAD